MTAVPAQHVLVTSFADKLAAEMGMYNDDPYGNLGRLQDELWRAVRLVLDTGLHHKR